MREIIAGLIFLPSQGLAFAAPIHFSVGIKMALDAHMGIVPTAITIAVMGLLSAKLLRRGIRGMRVAAAV